MAGLPEDLLLVAPTGRHGLPPNVVAAHQRERLIAATIELVAKLGYRGTTVDQIVKTAKVGYVAFNELFEGKEDCFLAAFERIVSETREQLVAEVGAELPWAEQICAALGVLVDLIAAEPARARVALVEVPAAGPLPYARYEAATSGVAAKLREGRALRPEAATFSDTLEEAIIAGIAWIFHRRLVKGEAAAIPFLLGEAIRIALAPYLGEAEAQRIAAASSAARL